MNIAFLSTAHIHTGGFLDRLKRLLNGRSASVIWDDVAERGQRYASEAGARFEADLETVLADASVDGFVICSENTRHLPLLRKAIAVGKPIFCEKPLVADAAELSELEGLLECRKAPVICGYFQPFSGIMLGIGAILEGGELGRITRIRYRNAHHAAYGRWFDSDDLRWFAEKELAGGGGFMDMGTHALHLARRLFGPAREVWAEIRNESGQYPKVDDYGIAHLRFASGVLGTVEAGWTQTGGIGGLEVVGSEKCLWNSSDGYVVGKPGTEAASVQPLPEAPARMERLLAAMRGKIAEEELQLDLECAVDAVRMMEAAYRSARLGRWVSLQS